MGISPVISYFLLAKPFESGYKGDVVVSVAQLVVAPGCGLGGRGFKSHRSPHGYSRRFRQIA